MNRVLFFISTLLLAVSSFAQQEKAYLHFDSNFYFAGDTVWYKAYVVRADNNKPTDVSRILYVELLNEQGYLVERQQLVIDKEGGARGQFALSDTVWAGFYEVRAYTKWMMNFGYRQVPKWGGQVKHIQIGGGGLGEKRTATSYGNKARLLQKNGKWMYWEDDLVDEGGEPFAGTFFDAGMTLYEDTESLRYRMYDNLFSRVIPVYAKPVADSLFRSKIMPAKVTMGDYQKRYTGKELSATLYPEGGQLLYGHECHVGWETTDKEGKRVNATGVLKEDGKEIANLTPTHAGRGSFHFVPKQGKRYEVRFSIGEASTSASMPKIQKEGCSMHVWQHDDSISIDVGREIADSVPLQLLVLARGKVVESVPLSGKDCRSAFHSAVLPAGVCQAVVIDTRENIFSDRLFFVKPHDEDVCHMELKHDGKQKAEPYGKITLSFSATDSKGEPLSSQTFSLAVADASQMDESFYNGNILTELLMQSDIRGFIENPRWYFEREDSVRLRALDELCMVQGWRRYDIGEVLHPEKANHRFVPEQKTVITGQAHTINKTIFEKDKGNIQLFCNLQGEGVEDTHFVGNMTLGKDGIFNIAYPPFYGDATLLLRAKYASLEKKKQYKRLIHDDHIFIRKEYFFPCLPKALDWFEINKPMTDLEHMVEGQKIDMELFYGKVLNEVVVNSKRRSHTQRRKDCPVFSVDALDYINDYWDMGYFNAYHRLDYGEFSLHDLQIDLLHFAFGQYAPELNEEAIITLNRYLNSPRATARSKFVNNIKHIDIVTDDPLRPSPFQIHHLDYANDPATGKNYAKAKYINIDVYSEEAYPPLRYGREYHFHGFNRPVQFYSPDYSKMPLPEVPDNRHTLYWAPDVTTDSTGHATIEFWNNSSCKEMFISAEGVTKDGRFVVYE